MSSEIRKRENPVLRVQKESFLNLLDNSLMLGFLFFMEKKMNVKQLASFTGKDVRTIRRWIVKAGFIKKGDKMSQVGKVRNYSIDEVETILLSGSMSMEAVSILMENARDSLLPKVQTPIDYEAIGKMIGTSVTAALTPVFDRLDKMSQVKALPEPTVQDYYSLTAYRILKDFKLTFSESVMHGKQLTKLCKDKDLEKRKIPDERYGFVNSYPVEILDEHFSV